MTVANVARVAVVLAACAAALGSASSRSSNQPQQPTEPQAQPLGNPPPPQQMDPGLAIGLWRSTFGAVKIEPDSTKGGLQAGALQGVWVYQRQGQEVIGYFAGQLRGNVLQFRWQEPNTPPLTGEGYLVFDVQGRQYNGRWWSDRRDRVGDWNGWRQGAPSAGQGNAGDPYGQGQGNAGDPYGQGQGGQGQYGGSTYAPPRQRPAPQPAPQPAPAPRTYY